ncbi:hypothetical protein PF002_g33332 [Phytophthora fragariae]|uniref:Uncharacterized protein n=1 Tax=Phytophthora fragariae TaxID=53985 RepID=A0A6A3UYF5_9STRA|nr:hypothetical protein PF002_g33332 [Phytophthora fragariae]
MPCTAEESCNRSDGNAVRVSCLSTASAFSVAVAWAPAGTRLKRGQPSSVWKASTWAPLEDRGNCQ